MRSLCYNPATDPAFNLALEEVLLTQTDRDILMLWRNRRAVIIGRNQNAQAEVDLAYTQAQGMPVVRRLSGGGAVFHDLGNINFTFIHAGEKDDFSNYERFTAPVCAFLRTVGLDVRLAGRNDLLLGDKKISGNAQVMKNGRMLHHGTILYSADVGSLAAALAPGKAQVGGRGVRSVRSRVTNLAQHLESPPPVEDFLAQMYAYFLNGADGWTEYFLTDADTAAAQKLADEKYATWAWNIGASPAYTHTKTARFPFGTVELRLLVRDGIIQQASIFGDFFGMRDKAGLEERLAGLPHRADSVAAVLHGVDVGAYISGMNAKEFLALV